MRIKYLLGTILILILMLMASTVLAQWSYWFPGDDYVQVFDTSWGAGTGTDPIAWGYFTDIYVAGSTTLDALTTCDLKTDGSGVVYCGTDATGGGGANIWSTSTDLAYIDSFVLINGVATTVGNTALEVHGNTLITSDLTVGLTLTINTDLTGFIYATDGVLSTSTIDILTDTNLAVNHPILLTDDTIGLIPYSLAVGHFATGTDFGDINSGDAGDLRLEASSVEDAEINYGVVTLSDFTNDGNYATTGVYYLKTEIDASTTGWLAKLTEEEVEDFAGSMVTGNVETLITVTYQDGTNTIDFVVDSDLHNYSWTNVVDADITNTLTASIVSDADKGDVNISGGAWNVEDLTISSEALGDILYFDGSNWVRIATGTEGQV